MIDYSKYISESARRIGPSKIRRFFDLANEMKGVISLGVGQPDFTTPWNIRQAGIESLEKGRTWYTANNGIKELLGEISLYLARRFDVHYRSDECIVTVGGSEGIDIAMRAVLNPGDEVLICEPCYVSYAPIAHLCGAVPVAIETKEENGFRVTPAEIRAKITPRTKLFVMAYPNNPTGAVMEREHLEAVAAEIQKHDILVLTDEIYAELTYIGRRHVSIAAIDGMRERTIYIGGFSKAYAMTGWRLGYVCAPGPLLEEMHKIHQYAVMCAPTMSQYAAVEALRNSDDDVARMVETYDMRRRLIVDGFRRLGFPCFEPKGAFYIFPSVRHLGLSSNAFCEKLLMAEKVAVVPGNAFGDSGEGFVRVSYCYSTEHIGEALARIERFVGSL